MGKMYTLQAQMKNIYIYIEHHDYTNKKERKAIL